METRLKEAEQDPQVCLSGRSGPAGVCVCVCVCVSSDGEARCVCTCSEETTMTRRLLQFFRHKLFWNLLLLVPLVIVIALVVRGNGVSFIAEWRRGVSEGQGQSQVSMETSKKSDPCLSQKPCADGHFSFYIHSGAANVVAAKICINNQMALGSAKSNAGVGINMVVVNGKTGEVQKTGHFDMYGGDVKPLVEMLKSVEKGSIVLMASHDEPTTKLNEEARKLIAELGSADIATLGFRDNWVFVGGKGVEGKSSLEKTMKNDKAKNKYEGWPELIELQGCIPKFLE